MNSSNYHKEIDGLRAVSVLVIILFHLRLESMHGGFIGVDVFFVISGFLITKIITSNLASGSFSFKDFYIRRSTRILPALIVTVVLVQIAGMYFLQPGALVQVAEQGIAALLSVSNFYFWSTANYWAPASEQFPLLHTWSLGVEEQFYLVYPLLLFACYRMAGMRGVILLLGVLTVAGTVASEVVLRVDRSAAFYLSPLRFYEFSLGGLGAVLFARTTALRQAPLMASVSTMAGLGLILYSAFNFNPLFYKLPGVVTLIPTVGALLVIWAGPSAVARLLLMNPVMSWLGKTSYSSYLVHWPIIVFYRIYTGPHLDWLERAVLIVAILGCAQLLSVAVERRFRLVGGSHETGSGLHSRKVLLGTLGVTIAALLVSGALLASKGWPSRLPAAAAQLLAIDPNLDMQSRKAFYVQECVPQGEIFCGAERSAAASILLLGDSRVLDIYIALRTAYPEASIRASYAMGCVPVFSPGIGYSPFFPDCAQFNQKRLQAALDAPPGTIVFLAQDLSPWRSTAVLETVERLRAAHKTVYLLGQFKMMEGNSPIEVAVDELRYPARGANLEDFMVQSPFALDGEFARQVRATGAFYVSHRSLFHDGQYHVHDRDTGVLLTDDGIHLNIYGARKFGEYLREHYPL